MFSNEECEALAPMLQTGGWRGVVMPHLAKLGQSGMNALCILPTKREGTWKDASDDYIRGAISAYQYVLSMFQNEVIVNQANRQREEFARNGEGVGSPAQASSP